VSFAVLISPSSFLERCTGLRDIDIYALLIVHRERAAINLQLISDFCDLTVPTSALGLVNLDDGIVGLAGTVSSLIGVYGAWKKTA
jgi:peroxin-11B